MVKPPDILLERDCTNDDVVEACSYGALNLKPENTLAKALSYILQSLLELLLQHQQGMLARQTLAKQQSRAIFVPKL